MDFCENARGVVADGREMAKMGTEQPSLAVLVGEISEPPANNHGTGKKMNRMDRSPLLGQYLPWLVCPN
jgi:hypothetical protein